MTPHLWRHLYEEEIVKRYILKRLLIALFVLFGISVIIFALINIQPGNPYSHMMSPNTSPELVRKKLEEIGYFDPIYVKYFRWIKRALVLDLGYSIKYSRPVIDVIGMRLENTVILMSASLLLSVIVGIFLGMVAAYKRNTIVDDLITIISYIGVSIPAFFFSLLLIKKFSYDFSIFPASGMYDVRGNYSGFYKVFDILRHLILPSIVLMFLQAASFVRYTRASMIEIVDKEYIISAMAKGMSFKRALLKHGLKNALIPIVTVFCLQIPALFSGALMTETVFVWPGIGSLGYEAVQNRDYPLIMGILMITAVLILLSNILADILYAIIDKRVELD